MYGCVFVCGGDALQMLKKGQTLDAVSHTEKWHQTSGNLSHRGPESFGILL